MGIPVPDPPIDYGDDCLICTPPFGSRWAVGETPEYVYVLFSGLEECPLAVNSPPNGQSFRLTQSDADPCVWWHVGSKWVARFYTGFPAVNPSAVWLHDSFGRPHFLGDGTVCPPEYEVFDNLNTVCSAVIESINGIAVIWWMSSVLDLVAAYNIPTSSQLQYELFMINETTPVHKFCNQEKSLNIKFEVP